MVYKMDHYDVCIIGAGAAGLSAGTAAAERGHKVIIVDKNKKAGMKLYATGNGKCNIANSHMAFCCYYDSSFAAEILGDEPYKEVIDFMKELGVECVSKSGYYYPRSGQASTVVWALLDRLRFLGTEILLNTAVDHIEIKDGRYIIHKNGKALLSADKLIIATGGFSMPSLGAIDENTATGLYADLGLKTAPAKPMLCPVITKEDLTGLAGVRTGANVSIYADGKLIEEYGEVQFTDYGLSGIVIFNMSYYEPEKLYLDTLNGISEEEFVRSFRRLKESDPQRSLHAFMNGYLNDKLAEYIISVKCGYSTKTKLNDAPEDAAVKLYKSAAKLEFTFKQLYGYEHSQVTKGGILTSMINPEDMRVKGVPGLYASGEAVDVAGKCGGYNLMFAIISGRKAGRS